jgi:hypothetical protein
VNTATAMTEAIIHTVAMIRPGTVSGSAPPARWNMVLADHHTPVPIPRAELPLKPSLA